MLAYKPAGTITLFPFDAGEELSGHTAPYDTILSVIVGEAAITIRGKKFLVVKGQMIIMLVNVPHSFEAVLRFKMVLTMIHT